MEVTPQEKERLALLVEECAEVQQIAMKILRHGYGSYNPFDAAKTSNRRLLEKEVGDLKFAIRMMIEYFDLSGKSIDEFMVEKSEKIQPYLHHNTTIDLSGK